MPSILTLRRVGCGRISEDEVLQVPISYKSSAHLHKFYGGILCKRGKIDSRPGGGGRGEGSHDNGGRGDRMGLV